MKYVVAIASGVMLTAMTVAPGLAASSHHKHARGASQAQGDYQQAHASVPADASVYPAFSYSAVKTDPDGFIRQQMHRLQDGNAAGG